MRKEINNNQEMKPGYLCIHFINGRTVIPKTCIHNYECWKCAFDQWLEEIEAEMFIPPMPPSPDVSQSAFVHL